MTGKLGEILHDLKRLSAEGPHAVWRELERPQPSHSVYSWTPPGQSGPKTGPNPLEARAVRGRMIRLWLDSFYQTSLAKLYVASAHRYPQDLPSSKPDSLADEWRFVLQSETPLALGARRALERWQSNLVDLPGFLREVSALLKAQAQDEPLAQVVQSYGRVIDGQWLPAAQLARDAAKLELGSRRIGMSLMAANLFLIADQPERCLDCLPARVRQAATFPANVLCALAAVKLEDRQLLAEASYWIERDADRHRDQAEASRERRAQRIQLGLQAPPKPFKNTSAFHGLNLGPQTQRLLMW